MAEFTWAAEEEGPWEEDQGKEGIAKCRQKALCMLLFGGSSGRLVKWFVE